jgi:hypothetical protein
MSYGHYRFNRMPFGLKNAFVSKTHQELSELQGIDMFAYLNDILIRNLPQQILDKI